MIPNQIPPSEPSPPPSPSIQGSELPAQNLTGSKNLNRKRERGRLRSKASRDRKKIYLEQLEQRVKELENENFRLQNLLVVRNEKIDILGEEPGKYLVKHQDIKKEMMGDFSKLKQSPGQTPDFKFFERFIENLKRQQDKHQKFLDTTFESLINHPFPMFKRKHWGDFEKAEVKTFSIIQKYSKLSKYQIPEFEQAHDINSLDRFVA